MILNHERPYQQERTERIRHGFPDVESILDRSEVPLMGSHTPIREFMDLTSSGSGSGKIFVSLTWKKCYYYQYIITKGYRQRST